MRKSIVLILLALLTGCSFYGAQRRHYRSNLVDYLFPEGMPSHPRATRLQLPLKAASPSSRASRSRSILKPSSASSASSARPSQDATGSDRFRSSRRRTSSRAAATTTSSRSRN